MPSAHDASRLHEPWGLLAILSIIGFMLIGGMLSSLSVYTSAMQPHFGWSEAAMGGGPVMLLMGMSAGNLLVGPMMTRLGAGGPLRFGTALALGGWIVAGLVRTLPEFMAAMGCAGLGVGAATIVPGIALISNGFHQQRGLAIALFIGSCALASSVMPAANQWLIEQLGWRQGFWTFGALAGPICFGALWALPSGAAAQGSTTVEEGEVPGFAREQALRLPAFWILTIVLTVSQLCLNAILFNLIAYLRKSGWDAADAVTLFSITNFMSLPGLLIGGHLSDRVSARILLPLILILQGAGTFALLGVGSGAVIPAIVFILCWGGVAGLPAQTGSMLLGEITGHRAYPALLGIVFTINGFAGALAPVIMGWVYQAAGGYAAPLLICACLCVSAALASLLCSNERRKLTAIPGQENA